MVVLKMQKKLAASIMSCGRHKIWMDPNEKGEIAMANTRVLVRKLIRDGFIIKKPKKVHSRFRARRRKVEKKRGRHLGMGSRFGSANARCSVQLLWMKRQRAMRRLLKRYFWTGKIDRKMYVFYDLNPFPKNRNPKCPLKSIPIVFWEYSEHIFKAQSRTEYADCKYPHFLNLPNYQNDNDLNPFRLHSMPVIQ